MRLFGISFYLMIACLGLEGCSNPLGTSSNTAEGFHPGIPSQISQIQATPLGTQTGGATQSTSFTTLPTKGNAVLIYTWAYDSVHAISIPAASCTDNQGNSYTVAVTTSDNSGGTFLATSICYVTKIAAPSGTFTVNVAPTLGSGTTQIEVVAVEYYGMSATPVDRLAVSNGNTASAATGTTLVTTENVELVGAIINSGAGVNPIVFTSLDSFILLAIQPDCAGFGCGQAETKMVTSTSAYVENWTVNAAAFYDTVIATFKAE